VILGAPLYQTWLKKASFGSFESIAGFRILPLKKFISRVKRAFIKPMKKQKNRVGLVGEKRSGEK
jgi:hypothetical protein